MTWQPLDDEESPRVPDGVRVIDAHVHLFPDRVFDAIWRWFDAHAWPVRYRLRAEEVIAFQRERGVEGIVALAYSHKPGMGRSLNVFVAELAQKHADVTGLGTVLPGEPDTRGIVAQALNDLGLRGIKIHCHVQQIAADDPRLDPVYEECANAGRPVVIHAGSEPACAEGYACDTKALCPPEAVARALARHPQTTIVVPHLGADNYEAYEALLDEYPNLYLDTTMALGSFFGGEPDHSILSRRADRLLFGTDFPNLPYAWDRELKAVLNANLTPQARDAILFENARKLFGVSRSGP
jgi:uncharacterized protein